MMARLAVGVLVLTLWASCKGSGEEEDGTGARDNEGRDVEALYSLAISGVQDKVAQGTRLTVVVQLKKNDKAVSDFKDSIELSLQIVCGTNKSEPSTQALGTDGKATFSDITLADKWSGKCTLRVSTEIFNDALKSVKRFTILPALADSQDYQFKDFKAGKLTLHNCGEAVLFTQAGDAAPVRVGSEVTIDDSDSTLFVVNVPAAGCELHHDGSFYGMVGVVAHDEDFTIKGIHPYNDKLRVILPRYTPKDTTIVLYASTDNGTTWHAHPNSNAGENTFNNLTWANTISHNQVLLAVTTKTQRHWLFAAAGIYADDATAGASAGKAFGLHGVDEGQSDVRIAKACGMRLFYSRQEQVQELTSEEDTSLHAEGGSLKDFFFIGTATANCQPTLQVNDSKVEVTLSGTAYTMPARISLIADGGSNPNIRLEFNSQPVPSDFPTNFELYLSNDGGGQWHKHTNNQTLPWRYSGPGIVSNRGWNSSEASNNQALFKSSFSQDSWLFYKQGG